jgi:hypothetical protein
VLPFHAVRHIDTLTFKDDYSKPQNYLTPAQLDACLSSLAQNAAPAGKLSLDEIRSCEKGAPAAAAGYRFSRLVR